MISIALHAVLIFGISITTYYKLPIFNESPIINVKLANSNQDYMTNISSEGVDNSKKELLNYIKESNKKIVSDLEKLELADPNDDEFLSEMERHRVGDTIDIVTTREGEEKRFTVELSEVQ